ncbi:hypothetical protein FF38_02577 [Lucilia cuprina]|uniref:Uncharacterized protein n=1 Tax=Lucilia cuprina TaxID=7375 RepID=A0A0L0C1H2_LUCCU|nr:hypothetical protein FF38_02577 [Lucilia cuprina]
MEGFSGPICVLENVRILVSTLGTDSLAGLPLCNTSTTGKSSILITLGCWVVVRDGVVGTLAVVVVEAGALFEGGPYWDLRKSSKLGKVLVRVLKFEGVCCTGVKCVSGCVISGSEDHDVTVLFSPLGPVYVRVIVLCEVLVGGLGAAGVSSGQEGKGLLNQSPVKSSVSKTVDAFGLLKPIVCVTLLPSLSVKVRVMVPVGEFFNSSIGIVSDSLTLFTLELKY